MRTAQARKQDTDAGTHAAQNGVGVRVKALREAMDLSLRDLAERTGVSAPMLSQVERGETSPTLAVASRIAAGLDLSLSQLMRLDEDRLKPVLRLIEPGSVAKRAIGRMTPAAQARRVATAADHLDPRARRNACFRRKAGHR